MKCFKDKNKKSSLLKILVFVSLLIKSAQGLKVTNLSPGVHIYPIGTCEVKATELVLTINTTLSIDSDKELIDKHVQEFPEICNIKHPDLQRYCMDWYKKVSEEAVFAKNKITSECSVPKNHVKRSVYGAVFQSVGKLFQVVAKNPSTSIALLGGAVSIYQGVKISQLDSKLSSKENSIRNTLRLMLNASDSELENHEQFLNELVQIGNNQSVRERITSFAASNIEVFNIMKQRYQNVFDLKPTSLLLEQMRNSSNLNGLRLPTLDKLDDIFEKSRKVKFCTNHTVMLEFYIPLVKNEIYKKYSVVTVPSDTRDIIYINNEKDLVTNIIVDNTNETFIDIENTIPYFDNIYELNNFQLSSKCLKEILKQTDPFNCILHKITDDLEKIYRLDDGLSVVFNEHNTTMIECSNKSLPMTLKASIVEHKQCGIKTENFEVYPMQYMTMNINYSSLSDLEFLVPEIIYTKIQPNDEFRRKFREEIEGSFDFNKIVENNYWRGAFVFVIIALLTFTTGIYLWFRKSTQKPQNEKTIDIKIAVGSPPNNPTTDPGVPLRNFSPRLGLPFARYFPGLSRIFLAVPDLFHENSS